MIIAGVDLEGNDRGALGFHGSILKHGRPGDVGGVGIVEVHDFTHGVEGEGKTCLFGLAVPVVGPVREYLARRSGHGRRVQLGVSGGGIGGVVHRPGGIGIICPAAPVVVEHYDDFLLLSPFARRSSIVGDIRIICEFLIQLRTAASLDGSLVGQLAVLNIIAVKGLDNIDLGAAARGNGTEDLIGTAGTAVASHHTGTRIGDRKFCARGAGHGQLVQQGDALAVGDDHGILIVHGRAIQSDFHAFRSFGEPHLVKAGDEGVPVGKIGGMASQVERLTRDLSSAFCRIVPPAKRIARASEAKSAILNSVVNRERRTAHRHGFGLRAIRCSAYGSAVAIVVHLNGIPDRVRGRGIGHALCARLIPDLHRVGQFGSLTGIRVRGHGVSSREGRGLFTFNDNTAGIAAGIDDYVLIGHFGRSSLNPSIGQQVRKIIGLLGIGVVGNLNRPGHLVTLVEDCVAHRIFQLHRLPVPLHAGQRLGYGDFGLRLGHTDIQCDLILNPAYRWYSDILTTDRTISSQSAFQLIVLVCLKGDLNIAGLFACIVELQARPPLISRAVIQALYGEVCILDCAVTSDCDIRDIIIHRRHINAVVGRPKWV